MYGLGAAEATDGAGGYLPPVLRGSGYSGALAARASCPRCLPLQPELEATYGAGNVPVILWGKQGAPMAPLNPGETRPKPASVAGIPLSGPVIALVGVGALALWLMNRGR